MDGGRRSAELCAHPQHAVLLGMGWGHFWGCSAHMPLEKPQAGVRVFPFLLGRPGGMGAEQGVLPVRTTSQGTGTQTALLLLQEDLIFAAVRAFNVGHK